MVLKWISNSPIADVFVVWGKDCDGEVRGFVSTEICGSNTQN